MLFFFVLKSTDHYRYFPEKQNLFKEFNLNVPERFRTFFLRFADDGAVHVDDVGGHVFRNQDPAVGELGGCVDSLKSEIVKKSCQRKLKGGRINCPSYDCSNLAKSKISKPSNCITSRKCLRKGDTGDERLG